MTQERPILYDMLTVRVSETAQEAWGSVFGDIQTLLSASLIGSGRDLTTQPTDADNIAVEAIFKYVYERQNLQPWKYSQFCKIVRGLFPESDRIRNRRAVNLIQAITIRRVY